MNKYFQWFLPILCVGFLSVAGCASRGVPSAWIPVGNEMEKVVDAETGRTVIYLTAGNSIDTQFHYHCGTWGEINGRTYLFFASSRKRPEAAGKTKPGERQIMAADVETGDLYYLTTIMNDGPGNLAQITFRPYYSAYNDKAKMIFFLDKPRNSIYGYNCLTGEQKKMLDLPEGAVSRELDDFVDGNSVRLIYPYTIRTKDGQLGFIAVSDFDRSLNLSGTRIVVRCQTNEALNHVSINPADKDVFFYKRHHEKKPDGSFGWASLYIKNLAEPSSEDFFVNSTNQTIDHMVWGASGTHIYWDDNAGKLWRLDYPSCKTQVVGTGNNIHNQLSPDEKLWVYDLRKDPPCFSMPFDGRTVRNWKGSIWIHDMAANTSSKYANIIWGDPHPRHPHAVFSPDGKMISFVTGMNSENSRVAIMRVDENKR